MPGSCSLMLLLLVRADAGLEGAVRRTFAGFGGHRRSDAYWKAAVAAAVG